MRRLAMLPAILVLIPLTGCDDMQLKAPLARLQEACGKVDPACGRAEPGRNGVEAATGVLNTIAGLCEGLDTGSAACDKKLQDLAGVHGQTGTIAGGWESIQPYGYKSKGTTKVQVGTAGTRYWLGAKDNKGGIYVSQVNQNVICGSADIVPPGVELTEVLGSDKGAPGETKEDLLCEKLYPGYPLALGTYVSMCVSTGWYESGRWVMNTRADEACVRTFDWRGSSEDSKALFRQQLTRYITGLAVDLETCSLAPAQDHRSRMRLECGAGEVVVFSDELRRL